MRRIDQIEESQATGEVQAFYTDFRETLGVSFVPTVFRSLARFPHYLVPAWSLLGPALGTTYTERAVAALRATMADRMAEIVPSRSTRTAWSAEIENEIRGALGR
jgi:hypothetical protein